MLLLILSLYSAAISLAQDAQATRFPGKLTHLIETINKPTIKVEGCALLDPAPSTAWDTFEQGARRLGSPLLCSFKSFEEACNVAAEDYEYSSDVAPGMDLFVQRKREYAELYFKKMVADPGILETCCLSDQACRTNLSSVKFQWLRDGQTYPGLGNTGYDPDANKIVFSESDQGLIKARFREEVETTIIHELGHACDHAIAPGTKLGSLEVVKKIGGAKIAECFQNPDPKDFPFGPPKDGAFGEPIAEIVFAKFRPLAIQWRSCRAFMYNIGLKCMFSTGEKIENLCK